MVYNRCVGTRYCSNNCPYKVRRFNWFNYSKREAPTHMALNPEVTVRTRGVMEKCTFCVQRQQEAKLTAKKENRKLEDRDTYVACANACPADAIVFGNVNNASSMVNKVRSESKNRLYFVLEQIHTLPNVSYMAKVRNSPTAGDVHHTEDKVMETPAATGTGH